MFDRDQNKGNSSDWKATAFINLFLNRKNGTKMKLGFIALKENDPETRLPALLEKLVLDYRRVEAKSDDGLDL